MFENNQGQEFEQVIEWANMAYYLKREAVIQKIAVPWKVERRFDYVSNTQIQLCRHIPREKAPSILEGPPKVRVFGLTPRQPKIKPISR